MPHDFVAEIRSIPQVDRDGRGPDGRQVPTFAWLDEIVDRMVDEECEDWAQIQGVAHELTKRMRKERKRLDDAGDSYTVDDWKEHMLLLAGTGALTDKCPAVRELLKMALYRSDKAADLRITANDILPKVSALSRESLTHLARKGKELESWLIDHPAAGPEVWEVLCGRYRYTYLGRRLAAHPTACIDSPAVREYVDAHVVKNCEVAEELCAVAQGERFRWAFDCLTRTSPVRALRILDRFAPSPERPVSAASMSRLLENEDAEFRLKVLTHSAHVSGPRLVTTAKAKNTRGSHLD